MMLREYRALGFVWLARAVLRMRSQERLPQDHKIRVVLMEHPPAHQALCEHGRSEPRPTDESTEA